MEKLKLHYQAFIKTLVGANCVVISIALAFLVRHMIRAQEYLNEYGTTTLGDAKEIVDNLRTNEVGDCNSPT